MKNPSVIAKGGLQAARNWVFRWRGLDGTPLRGLLSLLIVGSAFALFAATVRIRVRAPQQWVERKASIIHLPSGGEGKIWALRAQEGGPFPSRVDPADWEKSAGLQEAFLQATRLSSRPYEPKLRDLPEDDQVPPRPMSEKGERVFPKRTVKVAPVAAPAATKLAPVLFPLSGIGAESLPAQLPAFDAPIDAAMTAAAWRFLLRLRRDGSVSLCMPLVDEPGGKVLAKWLGTLNFSPAVAEKSEWIGLGVLFTNQVTDGSDAR